ncbi:hypothetical protein GCM10009839_59130 [Catenulispora yoronensis]|uniref:Uncharacterized protein n=1 Tax=Catenulispora yoronensis TaxID=450799 RepID=A0ABN2V0W8_9ACTN
MPMPRCIDVLKEELSVRLLVGGYSGTVDIHTARFDGTGAGCGQIACQLAGLSDTGQSAAPDGLPHWRREVSTLRPGARQGRGRYAVGCAEPCPTGAHVLGLRPASSGRTARWHYRLRRRPNASGAGRKPIDPSSGALP